MSSGLCTLFRALLFLLCLQRGLLAESSLDSHLFPTQSVPQILTLISIGDPEFLPALITYIDRTDPSDPGIWRLIDAVRNRIPTLNPELKALTRAYLKTLLNHYLVEPNIEWGATNAWYGHLQPALALTLLLPLYTTLDAEDAARIEAQAFLEFRGTYPLLGSQTELSLVARLLDIRSIDPSLYLHFLISRGGFLLEAARERRQQGIHKRHELFSRRGKERNSRAAFVYLENVKETHRKDRALIEPILFGIANQIALAPLRPWSASQKLGSALTSIIERTSLQQLVDRALRTEEVRIPFTIAEKKKEEGKYFRPKGFVPALSNALERSNRCGELLQRV